MYLRRVQPKNRTIYSTFIRVDRCPAHNEDWVRKAENKNKGPSTSCGRWSSSPVAGWQLCGVDDVSFEESESVEEWEAKSCWSQIYGNDGIGSAFRLFSKLVRSGRIAVDDDRRTLTDCAYRCYERNLSLGYKPKSCRTLISNVNYADVLGYMIFLHHSN